MIREVGEADESRKNEGGRGWPAVSNTPQRDLP